MKFQIPCILLALCAQPGFAQELPRSLSLNEAITIAKDNNKLISTLKTEKMASRDDVQDVKTAALPKLLTNAGYQRYSKIMLFDNGFGESHTISKPPNANAGNLGLEASLNLYSGGRQKVSVDIAELRDELSAINLQEQTGNIAYQVALNYLDLVRLYHLKKLIADQVSRARTRVKNITSFYNNQKVTKSDLLRAELLLSNVQLNQVEAENDFIIANQKLNVLLNLAKDVPILPSDSISLDRPDPATVEKLSEQGIPFTIQKADKQIALQGQLLKLSKANYLPSVSLVSAGGFNYPNNLVFPPQDQSYLLGFVGLRLSFDISSIYQNLHKTRAAGLRVSESRQQKEWLEDNISQEVSGLLRKYNEALNRIGVIQQSILQGESNYNIINTKYFNQLSLLTDLLDADNILQESRYNYIRAQVGALLVYYRLLNIKGQL